MRYKLLVETQISEEAQQRTAWRRRLVEAVPERQFDNEVLVTMLMAGFDQAHAEGLLDAAEVCKEVAAGSAPARRIATTLERSLLSE